MKCSMLDIKLADSKEWCHAKVPSEKLKVIRERYPKSFSTWSCNRPKDHKGNHHAHVIPSNACAATWTQEEAVVEAL